MLFARLFFLYDAFLVSLLCLAGAAVSLASSMIALLFWATGASFRPLLVSPCSTFQLPNGLSQTNVYLHEHELRCCYFCLVFDSTDG